MIDGGLPRALGALVDLPWPVKRRIVERPSTWRLLAGACRRLGWDERRLGWHAASNGPYAGIRLRVTHVNHLWIPLGTYELAVSHWLVRLVTEDRWGCVGKPVWDVGAHVGVLSLLCARHGSGPVISVEPDEANRARLRANVAANPAVIGRIDVEAVAVSDKDGRAEFCPGLASSEGQIRHPAVCPWSPADESPGVAVDTMSLDSLLARHPTPPGLLKLDIEGAEVLALAGASRLLEVHRPTLLVEVHNAEAADGCVRILSEAGYEVRRLDRQRLSALGGAPPSYGHLLAIGPDARARGERR